MANAIEANAEVIQTENAKDMAAGREMGLSKALLDRLLLNDDRVAGMATGLRKWLICRIPLAGCWRKAFGPTG